MRDVHYAVGGRAIFAGLDLEFRAARITAIMGPSGTGKTTLLRLITGQMRPDRGQVMVDGQDVAQLSRATSCTRCAGAWACCSRTARC